MVFLVGGRIGKAASGNKPKTGLGIGGRGCPLAKYNCFLRNAGIRKPLEEMAGEIAEKKGKARILDIGCGNARAMHELRQMLGKRVWVCGMDLLEPEFGLDEKIVGDALEKGFPKKIDAIVSFRALHEIGLPEKILQKCCTALAPGGKAILSFRAMENSGGKLRYVGEMRAEDIEFLEAVIEEGRFGKCIASGKTIYLSEEAEANGKKGMLAFVGGVNVFLKKP